MIETDEGAAEVFNYIEAHIRDRLKKTGDQTDES
ncbi:hypothetical protein B5K06_27160 [Rhizobium grahamii]|uniref:Uncharacterized protein n=1 Tax=Rhizobium grahamii TaxID=1120045 RepID=A0A370KH97_9HYPH|nr:hypothetical protein B5K06_27160 [Rhizobium grahamii]